MGADDEAMRGAAAGVLLKTYASLTHRLHAARGRDAALEARLRGERGLVEAEILRRMEPDRVVGCWACEGSGTLQANGEDCPLCRTTGRLLVTVRGPALRRPELRAMISARMDFDPEYRARREADALEAAEDATWD